jgi:hypothetical protein
MKNMRNIAIFGSFIKIIFLKCKKNCKIDTNILKKYKPSRN